MSLFSGSVLLVVMILIEVLIIRYIKKENVPWREVIFNINSGHILMWFFRSIEILMFTLVLQSYSLRLLDSWSFLEQWIFTFFAWDFCFYWLHRMHHKIPLFWKIHVVHHEGEHFSLSLGLRNSWYSSLSSIPFFITLAFIGVPLPVFVSISSVHYFVQFYNHNGVVKKSGILEKFMVTPALHRVHHGYNEEYIDKNFCGTLNIWDKLFGTHQKEIPGVPILYGVPGAIKTENPLYANNIPFMQSLNIPVESLGQKEESTFKVPDMYVFSGGMVLLGLWLYYIYHEHDKLVGMQQLSFFSLVFIGTIALGSMSDKKVSGLIGWILITTITSFVFLMNYNIPEMWALSIFGMFILHGIYGIKWLLKSNNKQELTVEM